MKLRKKRKEMSQCKHLPWNGSSVDGGGEEL